jgi:hypothetical protein
MSLDLLPGAVDSSASNDVQQQIEQRIRQHQHRHDDKSLLGGADEFSRDPTLSGGGGQVPQRWNPPRVLTTRRPGSSSIYGVDDAVARGGNDLPYDRSLQSSTNEPPFKNNFGYPIFSVKSTNKKTGMEC